MTSKISFSKMVRSEMRQMNWMTAIWGLLFGLLIPFRLLLVMAMNASRISSGWGDTPVEVFCQYAGLGQIENSVLILFAGAFCALYAFSYLDAPEKLDLYHSLAVRRERLFAVRYCSSVLTFVLPYLICQVLSVLIGIFYGAMTSGMFLRLTAEILLSSVQGVLQFLCSYAGVLLAVMLTGKILTAVCAAGVFLCYIPFLWALQRVLRIEFFNTSLNSGYFALSSVPVVKCSSPWVFALYQMTQGGRTGLTGKFPTVTELCQLLAIAVLLTGISLLLYRIRKTEAAGQALAFRRTEGVIKLLLTVPVTIMSALVGYELFRSVVWEIVFLLLFGGLACMIMEFMYRWDIRQVAQHRLHMVATVVLAGLVFFAFQFDLTGYNTYLPAKEDLAGMAVRDMYLEICYPEVTGSYANTNADAQKLLDYFETDDVDLLYSLAENGVAHVRGTEETSEPTVYVEIKYHTKSGKEVYRGYYVDEELFLDTMDGMMKDAEFREKYFPILSWDEEQIRSTIAFVSIAEEDANGIWYERSGAGDDTDETEGTVAADASAESSDDESEEYYEDWTDDSGSLSLDIPVSDLEEVVEAYCSDLQMTSWRDIWMTGSYLSFEHPQEPASWYSYDLYPFSGSFEQTMEVMRKIQETK